MPRFLPCSRQPGPPGAQPRMKCHDKPMDAEWIQIWASCEHAVSPPGFPGLGLLLRFWFLFGFAGFCFLFLVLFGGLFLFLDARLNLTSRMETVFFVIQTYVTIFTLTVLLEICFFCLSTFYLTRHTPFLKCAGLPVQHFTKAPVPPLTVLPPMPKWRTPPMRSAESAQPCAAGPAAKPIPVTSPPAAQPITTPSQQQLPAQPVIEPPKRRPGTRLWQHIVLTNSVLLPRFNFQLRKLRMIKLG